MLWYYEQSFEEVSIREYIITKANEKLCKGGNRCSHNPNSEAWNWKQLFFNKDFACCSDGKQVSHFCIVKILNP